MVRNLRQGLPWIQGTIIERTGPVSYLVQVSDAQIWKRHIDHLREMGDSPQQPLQEPAAETDDMSDPREDEFPDTTPEQITTSERATPSAGDVSTSIAPPTPSAAISRYPSRTRRPPQTDSTERLIEHYS